MALTTPEPIQLEHHELHERLHELTQLSGRVGEAARSVAHILRPHFRKEEETALPPLALLPAIAGGETPAGAEEAIAAAARLKSALPEMVTEHRAIGEALERLAAVATSEGNKEAAGFADALRRHAEFEEFVLYPAAILVGEYLRLWLGRAE